MNTRYRVSAQSRAITSHFYAWDYRLRGYDLWYYPVHPEPVFQPFFDREYDLSPITDDTRSHSLLSSLVAGVGSFFASSNASVQVALPVQEESSLEPDLYVPEGDIYEFQIALPRDTEYSLQTVTHFLSDLRAYSAPLSFEIIGTATHIALQCAVREQDAALLDSQLSAFFPDAVITTSTNYLHSLWEENLATAFVDFGLDQEVGLPLEVHDKKFAIDPYVSLCAAMDGLEGRECAAVQILFAPVRHNWATELVTAITDDDGTSIFSDAAHLLKSTHEKVQSPLVACTIRAAVKSETDEKASALLKRVGSALMRGNLPHANALIPLENDLYPESVFRDDLLYRLTHRSGMLLSINELVGFVHLPDKTVQSKKLLRADGKTKEAPFIVANNELHLGVNTHHGKEKEVTLSQEQRMRHMYVIGASGTGKSTLLLNLLSQDITAGRGCCLLDPHGDLTNSVLEHIPESRYKDVIILDPSDEEFPIGFNIFHARSEAEKILLSSDLIKTFERLSTSWGDRMNAVLGNGILAMLEHPNGGTLLTLRRFLTDKAFRKQYVSEIDDPEMSYYWEKEYPLLTGRPEAPVLTRLDTFLRTKTIRNMVAQEKSAIDFSDAMNSGKIILCKLSHGGIGEENSYLLGTLIVTAIYQAALRRQALEKESRTPFYLYIDEFQNFVTPSMEAILSGARKYNLGLILAHQERRQLLGKDREVASSVLSNPYTRMCFRMGDEDAYALAKGLSSFDAQDLQSLGIGQAIVRTEQAQYDFNLSVPWTPQPDTSREQVQSLIAQSQKTYGTPREYIESFVGLFYARPREEDSPPTKRAPEKRKREEVSETAQSSKQAEKNEHVTKTVSPPEHFQKKEKTPGRGGPEHKYLQQLICKYAQERGLGAEIEKEILDGKGFVDVSLTAGDKKIAVEISVTTSVEHEVENIKKCVKAGYHEVLLVVEERKRKEIFEDYCICQTNFEQLSIMEPAELLTYIDCMLGRKNAEYVRGYKVHTEVKTKRTESSVKARLAAKLIASAISTNT